MRTNHRLSRVIRGKSLVILGLTLSGCLHNLDLTPKPLNPFPENFVSGNQKEMADDKWWIAFKDASLNEIMAEALTDNQQLLSTWSRLKQAETMMDQANATWWPSINASFAAGRAKQNRFFPETDVINGSLQASYELDVWGKLSNQRQAAAMDLASTRDSLESVAMTLAAEVTEAWFGWMAQQAQLRLLNSQLDTNKTYLELIDVRFSEGLANASDVFNLRQQVEQSRAQIEEAERLSKLHKNRLAVLVGKAPGQLRYRPGIALPDLPPIPATGVPADLVKNRPDVRSAERSVIAADARVGIALTNRFPTLKITANVGVSAASFTELFDQVIYSVLGNITQPLFQGGALKAEQTRAEAALQEQIHLFSHSVLKAIAEVENALSNQEHETKRLKFLEKQRDYAASALEEARERYLAGLSEFLPVLSALGTLQRIEKNVVMSQKQVRSYRVQLCRALGGSWTKSLQKKLPFESDNPS
ncbi:MAG: efflux transporter outer membrane subunit [Myxococcota bacterium]|nr:efflux transporter outer membrane subunit [Myxococcota bacterium]